MLKQKGQTELLYLFLVVIVASLFLGGWFAQPLKLLPTNITYIPVTSTPEEAQQNLQLNAIRFITKVPTPTPTPIQTITNTPTPTSNPTCGGDKVAVNFLLDTSGSMGTDVNPLPPYRIEILVDVMRSFGDRMQADDVVGIQAFSDPSPASPFGGPPLNPTTCSNLGIYNRAACEVLPIGLFNKPQYLDSLTKLIPYGQTYTKDAFLFTKPVIDAKINLPEYAGYRWVLVFLSDGHPNPPNTQHPLSPVDVIAPIKADNRITIVTIGLGQPIIDYDPGLMTQIATAPHLAYQAERGSDLAGVYEQILQQVICR